MNPWPTKKLGDTCDFKSIKNTKYLPYVGMEDIESNSGHFIGSLTPKKVKSTTAYFDASCVLYGKLRPYLNKVFLPDFEGQCSTEFVTLRPDLTQTSREWLTQWLRSERVVVAMTKSGSGTRMPRANLQLLRNFNIPLPPLEIQKKVVKKIEGLFAKIDQAQSLRESAIRNTNNLIPATLNKIFEEGRSKGWEEKELGEICEKTSNINWNEHKNDNFQYIDLSSVSRKNFSITETKEVNSKNAPSRAKKIVNADDVIFGTTRPTLMRVTIIPPEYNNHICSTGFVVLRARKEHILPQFIYYFIRSERFMDRMGNIQTGASYPAVSDAKVMETKIPLPPLAEQKKIVARLDALTQKVRDLQTLQSQTASDLTALKQSILHKAFQGEL